MSRVTAEMVRAYRDETGVGLLEAKHILQTRELKKEYNLLMSEGTLEEKVNFLMERYALQTFSTKPWERKDLYE